MTETANEKQQFVKRGELGALRGEEAGLAALRDANVLRVPRVLRAAQSNARRKAEQSNEKSEERTTKEAKEEEVEEEDECAAATLVLERLQFVRADEKAWRALGKQLAQLHRSAVQSKGLFGFPETTWCGALPQDNTFASSWSEFFVERRLRPQLERAHAAGFVFAESERLLDVVRTALPEKPTASLLHGDLWSGNAAHVRNADTGDIEPVIYDPAAYYGDREADIGMTHFFGGFPPAFYDAYENEWPLSPGADQRRPMLNLFHALNHLNIFGGGYFSQCKSLIREILSFDDED